VSYPDNTVGIMRRPVVTEQLICQSINTTHGAKVGEESPPGCLIASSVSQYNSTLKPTQTWPSSKHCHSLLKVYKHLKYCLRDI